MFFLLSFEYMAAVFLQIGNRNVERDQPVYSAFQNYSIRDNEYCGDKERQFLKAPVKHFMIYSTSTDIAELPRQLSGQIDNMNGSLE